MLEKLHEGIGSFFKTFSLIGGLVFVMSFFLLVGCMGWLMFIIFLTFTRGDNASYKNIQILLQSWRVLLPIISVPVLLYLMDRSSQASGGQ